MEIFSLDKVKCFADSSQRNIVAGHEETATSCHKEVSG